MTRVPSITSARQSRTLDRRDRERRYLYTMGVRMACLFLAILLPSPWRWVFAVGAIVLPYIAVVLANIGSTKLKRGVDAPVEQTAIGTAPYLREEPQPGEEPYLYQESYRREGSYLREDRRR